MTKQGLKNLAKRFIERQGTYKDDWYVSEQRMAETVLTNFFREMLNVNLEQEDEVINVQQPTEQECDDHIGLLYEQWLNEEWLPEDKEND